jgi:23S rRNA pseudouridine2457 synthase
MPDDHPHRYLLFNKPYDVLSSFTDPEGRYTLAEYVPVHGVYAAGRLDQDSEGLMLLTDDGALGHRLTHPDHHLPKTYLAQVEGVPDAAALEKLRRGVMVKGEMTAPAEVELLDGEPALPPRPVPIRYRAEIPTCWLRIVLREGKKRQVRHMTAAVGYPTLRLVRIAIGPLELGSLLPGEWRDLTPAELSLLRKQLYSPSTRNRPHDRSENAPATPRSPHRVRRHHPVSRRSGNPGAGRV